METVPRYGLLARGTARLSLAPATQAVLLLVLTWAVAGAAPGAEPPEFVELAADVIADKIHGGLVGQLLGNLNGLPHEMKYIREPGTVAAYTPSLPDGARTDDDTDLEWMYVLEMERGGMLFVPPARLRELWVDHCNGGIWCANEYARRLMGLGLEPPVTGRSALNPWSHFNISGQFASECFGLAAPAMPQTAARLGLHYTHVAVDGEPTQATQLFTTMIATAFVENDIEKIIAAGLAATDPASDVRRVVADTLAAWKDHPDDWKALRRAIQAKYMKHGGSTRDSNGYELNTSCVVAALLYGCGDFAETLRLAFNLGYDADCNAATAGTVVGVIRGRRWMSDQGWTMRDVYRNSSRPGLPTDETISRFADRLLRLAERTVLEGGGRKVQRNGKTVYQIRRQEPANVEPLARPEDRFRELQETLLPQAERDLGGSDQDRARAAYLLLCLGLAPKIRASRPDDWQQAIEALRRHTDLLKAMSAGGPDPTVAKKFKALAAEVRDGQMPETD